MITDNAAIRRLLNLASFRYSNEAELQAGVAEVLTASGFGFDPISDREVILSPTDRIDFLIGTVGVEVKIGGSPAEIFRQLMRYAESPRIESLIVVTNKVRIARGLPGSVLQKPLDVISLAEAAL
ncbi:MAG TPA: hypothetical protein VK504_11535 [Vicinamibacterales bacterium]|nr:hypothetical protein [Vicinamibacterales bacterium]